MIEPEWDDPSTDVDGRMMNVGDMVAMHDFAGDKQCLFGFIFLGYKNDKPGWHWIFGPNGLEVMMFPESWRVIMSIKDCEDLRC